MENDRVAPRVPFETNVYLEFERFSGFISEYSLNISETGMFIKSKSPMPVGSIVSFEFRLKDHFSLIQGMGEVIWARTQDESPDRPAGMGIRFRELSNQSRELIKTMTHTVVSQGKSVFEVDEPLEKASQTAKSLAGLFEETGAESAPSISSTASKPESPHPSPLAEALKEDFAALFSEPETPPSPPSQVKEPEFVGRVEDSQAEVKIPLSQHPSIVETPDDLLPQTSAPSTRTPRRPNKGWLLVFSVLVLSLVAGAYVYWEMTESHVTQETFAPSSSVVAANAPTPLQTPDTPQISTQEPSAPVLASAPSSVMAETAQGVESTQALADLNSPPSPQVPAPTIPPATASTEAMSEPVSNPPPASPPPSAKRVQSIDWMEAPGRWTLRIVGDGTFHPDAMSHTSIREGKPREVVKLVGIEHKYPKNVISLNSPAISQIRVGHHPTQTPPELHLVLDLKDAKLRLTRSVAQNEVLELYFEPTGP